MKEYLTHVRNVGVINAAHIAGSIDDTKYDIKITTENARHYFADKAGDYPSFSGILNPMADIVQMAGDITCDLYDLF